MANQSDCPVCQSGERDKIEVFLANGGLPTVAATIWDQIPVWAFSQHRDEHMHGIAVRVDTDPVRVVSRLQDLAAIALENVHDAKAGAKHAHATSGALKVAILAEKCVAETVGVKSHLDLSMLMPMWQKMQQAILSALEEFPEARQKVLERLDQVSSEMRGLH